jgi:hypothetical protein
MLIMRKNFMYINKGKEIHFNLIRIVIQKWSLNDII